MSPADRGAWRGLRVRCGRIGIAAAVLLVLLVLMIVSMVSPVWPARVPRFADVRAAYVPSEAWLLDRNGTVIDSKRIRFDVRRLDWVPLADVSPALLAAIIQGEDRRFWQHGAVDWHSVLGALRDRAWRHRRRGASTITMQLASLLGSRRSNSTIGAWLAKLEQMRVARALEKHWSKPEILEAYLNLLEYRGEFQGIGAAAAELTGKRPSGLSNAESAVLAALLPQPDAGQDRTVMRACARAAAAAAKTAELAVGASCDGIRAAAAAIFAPHPRGSSGLADNERLAPQLAQALLKHPGESIRTSIDAGTQRLALDIVRGYLESMAERNVRDGAALVVDNGTGEVLAYVASGGEHSRAPAVDGVRALRQAGSTLKPFLYELALERRYLSPASLLADSPLSLDTASGVYIPQDYDHSFKGLVSVRTALASSLNVPAVRTLLLVGVEAFRNRLNDLGYTGITEAGQYYGYSLALGSAEVTLWQQAQAYRALARGGAWSPITLTRSPDARSAARALPADASFLVSDILSDAAARAATFGLDNHLSTDFWSAVKTGTSEDMRDNWCIGFSSRFTVAVWVGNFEGESMHDVSGVSGAAPIWHDIMSELHRGVPSAAPAAPAGLVSRLTSFASSVEPARREWYWSDAGAGERESSRVSGRNVAVLSAGALPKIDSPANGMIIAIDPDIPPPAQRVLISIHGALASMRLTLNDRPLGAASPQRLWEPHPGVYRLTLEDDAGKPLDRVMFTVRGSSRRLADSYLR